MGLRCTRYFEMPVVWLQLTSILDELTVEALIEGAGGSGMHEGFVMLVLAQDPQEAE